MPAISIQGASPPRVYNETPSGAINCVNTTYVAAYRFNPESLVVKIDGIILDPDQYVISPDMQSFTLVINENEVNALHSPLCSSETIKIDYNIFEHACITRL